MHDHHWKPLGVAGAAVSNQSPLDAVILGCKQEADEFGLSEHGVGRCCGVVGLLSNGELDVPEPEGVLGSVGTVLALYA